MLSTLAPVPADGNHLQSTSRLPGADDRRTTDTVFLKLQKREPFSHTSGTKSLTQASQANPSIPPRRFIGQLAGGDVAMRYEAEGVDESIDLGKADLAILSPPLNPELDTVVGILLPMSSLYVLGGLKFAKDMGCLVLGIARMRIGAIGSICNHVIECNTEGPEMGFKAGLALKMVSACLEFHPFFAATSVWAWLMILQILGMITDGVNHKAATRRRGGGTR